MSDKPVQVSGFVLYKRLLSYALPYKWVFLLSVVGMILVSISETSFAALLKPIMDGGFVERDEAFIRKIPFYLILIFVARGIGEFIETYFLSWVGRKVIFDLRAAMFDRMTLLSATFYDQQPSAGLVSKLIYDVEQVSQASTQAVRVIIQDTLTTIALLGWMFYLSWKLTLILLVIGPIVGFLVRVASRHFRKVSERIQSSIGSIAHIAKETFQGQRVIKSYGGQKYVNKLFKRINNDNRRQAMKKAAISAISVPVIIFIAGSAVALVIYLATSRVGTEAISAGSFVSFLSAMLMLMSPLKRLAKINAVIQTGVAAAGSIFSIIDEPAENDTGETELKKATGFIEYDNVSFTYPNAEKPALKEVSLTIHPGETVALVGASGSGKSTVASLLLRYYAVSKGEIRVDGFPLDALILPSLRKNIAIVTQEVILFDDTIRSNIAYGVDEIDEALIQSSAKAAHVLDFANALPEKLDARVGEQGLRLSGGQRQRIAIARALYKNAPILILDEATSALDSESEKKVQEAITNLIQNRTTLVIAHRLSTIERADKILVFDQGRIVEQGKHHELLSQKGFYHRLYRNQFVDDKNIDEKVKTSG